jgi:hypothetical protein
LPRLSRKSAFKIAGRYSTGFRIEHLPTLKLRLTLIKFDPSGPS